MFKNLSFRKKIIFSQLLLFILFLAISFPFIESTSSSVLKDSLIENTVDLIDLTDDVNAVDKMIDGLKKQEYFVFSRVTLLNDRAEILYDSLVRSDQEKQVAFPVDQYPEIKDALEEGTGYRIASYSESPRKFAYVAQKFTFQGKTYLLRTAFPYTQILEITQNFEVEFILFAFLTLLFFTASTWVIFHRLSRPITQIIDSIRPYQLGQVKELPEVILEKKVGKKDEFYQLAQTLNSLSSKIRMQIQDLTEERNEKEAILESLGEGVIAVNHDFVVTYVNFIGSKMLGIPRKQMLGRHFPSSSDKTPEAVLKKCADLLKNSQEKGQILTDSLSFGEERKVYIDLVAAPKSQGQGSIIVLQDKTSHYKVLEMGKDFVANASHELRTPITIIKGFAETLHDLPQMSHEMLVDITEKIMRNCERMETLVKNLLTLADLENIPAARFKECDIVSVIEHCAHIVKSVRPDTHIHINRSKEKLFIFADSDILELAITNLLDNAAKYSKPPADITITVKGVGDEVEIAIADKGIGIPKEDLEHIFERFYTVDKARSRRLGGAGLGLSIVKTIIDKHEGSITVTSEVGKGSTFIIRLPKTRQIQVT